jgi:hypothetical protein
MNTLQDPKKRKAEKKGEKKQKKTDRSTAGSPCPDIRFNEVKVS